MGSIDLQSVMVFDLSLSTLVYVMFNVFDSTLWANLFSAKDVDFC
jgi:hypothetical protein